MGLRPLSMKLLSSSPFNRDNFIGFKGKIRKESQMKLNHLTAVVNDEYDFHTFILIRLRDILVMFKIVYNLQSFFLNV